MNGTWLKGNGGVFYKRNVWNRAKQEYVQKVIFFYGNTVIEAETLGM